MLIVSTTPAWSGAPETLGTRQMYLGGQPNSNGDHAVPRWRVEHEKDTDRATGHLTVPDAADGDGAPGRPRRRLHAHKEELPVVLAVEHVRSWLGDVHVEGHPVPERRRRPLVMAGEVVQEFRRRPGEAAAGLRALERRVGTLRPVAQAVVVDGLLALGAPGAAVDEDGLDGALHAVAAREGAGAFSTERALRFCWQLAASRTSR
jgi:hypothetical protein